MSSLWGLCLTSYLIPGRVQPPRWQIGAVRTRDGALGLCGCFLPEASLCFLKLHFLKSLMFSWTFWSDVQMQISEMSLYRTILVFMLETEGFVTKNKWLFFLFVPIVQWVTPKQQPPVRPHILDCSWTQLGWWCRPLVSPGGGLCFEASPVVLRAHSSPTLQETAGYIHLWTVPPVARQKLTFKLVWQLEMLIKLTKYEAKSEENKKQSCLFRVISIFSNRVKPPSDGFD